MKEGTQKRKERNGRYQREAIMTEMEYKRKKGMKEGIEGQKLDKKG